MDFEHVLVVGAGQMGGGIAQVAAASGRRVSLYDSYPGATERGHGELAEAFLRRGSGRLDRLEVRERLPHGGHAPESPDPVVGSERRRTRATSSSSPTTT